MVILLNGVSSAGKTSIATELRKRLNKNCFYFGLDQFLEPSMPISINMDVVDDLMLLDRAISGFHKALGSYAESIDLMVVDLVLQKPTWLCEVAETLKKSDVFFVEVTAPLPIIEQRERERADRQVGTAKSQYDTISSYTYDITIDTSKVSSVEAADFILKNLKGGHGLQSSSERIKSIP